MNLSEPFIKRPVATSLLAAALFLAGAAAYSRLPVAPLPRVDFPTINVSASLPGASPETMASAVAAPLERRFGRIAGISEITSSSSLGATSLTLQFALERDVDSAARDVQAAINAAGGDLPPNLPNLPSYRKVNPSDAPILILTLTSATLPLARVYDAAANVLAQRISRVPGVGQVLVAGAQAPAVRVAIDPVALAGAHLDLEDVRIALSRASVDQPKGSLSGPVQSLAVGANDQLGSGSASPFEDVILAWNQSSPVRVRDVGRATDGLENERVAAWSDGTRCVTMLVRRQPDANVIDVIERVKALLPSLSQSISPAIDVHIALDRSGSIRASVEDIQRALALSVLLVVLVVFAFLGSARAAVIPSVSVPLSLIGTFAAMWLLDFSLDNLSLMALTISTGFVVDDAIVVAENIARRLELGEAPMAAALEGARQVGFTIVSITLSLLAVFIPMLFMGGIVGRLFREFAVTLSAAIALSALISLTLTPAMAARLLRPPKRGERGRLPQRAFERLRSAYGRALSAVLRHPALALAVLLLTVALNVYLFIDAPKGLFPQQDTGSIGGAADGPQDISFPAMRARQEAVNDVLKRHPAIEHFTSFVGGGTLNTANFFMQLKPLGERRQSADEVIAELRPKLARVPGIQVYLQSVQDVRMGGRPTRTQYQYALQDVNLAELAAWAPKVLDRLRGLPELKDVATDQQTQALELAVEVDRDDAARLGLSFSQIDQILYDAFGQRQVSTLFTPTNYYRVVLEAAPGSREHPDALDRLYIRPPGGDPVPLSAVARYRPAATLLSVNHQGQFPAVTLSFNLSPGVALGQAVESVRRAQVEVGLPASIRASFQGTAQAFQESLSSQPMLILLALLAVYIVLGVLYESLVHPITILSTLPSAGVGALLALRLFHMELSVIAIIGLILLVGIVKKNGILMVDFALDLEREQGLPSREAITQACLLRFRPILMTTLAAMLGGLPLAIGFGTGSELRRPLGVAIVGGLLLSQLLTLFTTPVVYLALDRLRRG